VCHQRSDDPAGRVVDGHGQPDADAGDCCVDANHAPRAVGQRAAAVAGVEGGIGLDHLVDHAPCACRQRTSEGRDDACGDAACEPERVAQGYDELPDAQLGRVAEQDRRWHVAPSPQDGEVGKRITADHVHADRGPIGESRLSRISALDHVRAGQQEAVRGQHTCAAGTVSSPRPHMEACHAGKHALGHTYDGGRVRVQRFEIIGHT